MALKKGEAVEVTRNDHDLAGLIGGYLQQFERMAFFVQGHDVVFSCNLIDPDSKRKTVRLVVAVEKSGNIIVKTMINMLGDNGRSIPYHENDWGYRLESKCSANGSDRIFDLAGAMNLLPTVHGDLNARSIAYELIKAELLSGLRNLFRLFDCGALNSRWAESATSTTDVYNAINGMVIGDVASRKS